MMMKRWKNESIEEYLAREDAAIASEISEAILCNAFGPEEKKDIIARVEQLEFLKKNPWLFSLIPIKEPDVVTTEVVDDSVPF